jgi:hypothetical protein
VRTDGVRGEAAAALLDGLAVRAGAARVVQRLLQHDVRLVRAANAPRAVFVVPTSISSQSFRERLPEKPRNGLSCSARAQERACVPDWPASAETTVTSRTRRAANAMAIGERATAVRRQALLHSTMAEWRLASLFLPWPGLYLCL